jgi:antitoxin component of MazEF toxin-antitoxin module
MESFTKVWQFATLGMPKPANWLWMPLPFTPSHNLSTSESLLFSCGYGAFPQHAPMMSSGVPSVPLSLIDRRTLIMANDVVVPARPRQRLKNAKLPRQTRLSFKQPRWRLRNCKLPRAGDLGNASAVLNRTTTWDKAPLQGDPWLHFLLKQSHDRQWRSESTNVSDCDEDDEQSIISDQCAMDTDEDAVDPNGEGEEDWDEIIAWAARPTTDFAGVWVPASIYGEMLTWNEGEKVSIEVLSSKKFRMCYVGTTYVAELSDNGTLHWNDGDVWSRRKSSTCTKDETQTFDHHPTHEDSKFDGVWGPACLRKGVLTWNEGEDVEVDVLSDTKFRMTYVGKVCSAELRRDGKLHWSDGDVWSRRSIPCTTDLPVCNDLPAWLSRRSQNRRSIRPVASSKIASSTLCRTVGQVPCRSAWPSDASRGSQPEVTSRCEGDIAKPILCEKPSNLTTVSGATSYAAVATLHRASSNKMQHHAADQSKNVATDSRNAAPLTTSLASNVRQPRGRTVEASAPINNKRYTGIVSWFRGSYGWVDCVEVKANYNGLHTFLHSNDCDFNPRQGDEVEFRLALDNKGNPKAVNATQAKAPVNARDWFAARQKR